MSDNKTFGLITSELFGKDTAALLGQGVINQLTYDLKRPEWSVREKFTIHVYSVQLEIGVNAELEIEGSADGTNYELLQTVDPGSAYLDLTVGNVVQESALPYLRFRMKNSGSESVFVIRTVL